MELQVVAAIRRMKAFFYCWIFYLGLTLILLISHMNTATAQSQTPTCTPMQEDCTTCQTQGDLRLVGGGNFTEGRVEFCFNNTWGTVCDNGFGVEDAMVVCRQLGFSDQGALDVPFAAFGQGTGPIILNRVACVGNEARLIDCEHNGLGVHDCVHMEDVGVSCMIQSIVTGTVSISATIQIQSITPTQTPVPTDSSIRISTTSFTFSTNEVDRSILLTSPITASPTSGSVILTTISSSLVLTTSEPSVAIVTSLSVSQSQSNSGGRESSIITTTSVTSTGPFSSRDSSNTGLIVGLVFLFLIVIIVVSIVIVLLVIIILRKKKEKKIERSTRHWYIQENPVAQLNSFEGDSIFNLLEDANGSLRPSAGNRNSVPDFLVVHHRPPVSTVPNAYNSSPGLETKSIPVKKTDKLDKVHNDDITELSKSPPSSLISTILDDTAEGVMYTDVTFKSGTPLGTRMVLYDVQEEDSDWSQQSSFEDDEDEKPEAKGKTSSKEITYSEVQIKNS